MDLLWWTAGCATRPRSDVRYVLSCLSCGTIIVTTERIGDAEAAAIARHFRVEHPEELPAEPPSFAELLSHVRVKMV